VTDIAATSDAPAAVALPHQFAVACSLFAASAALCVLAYLALTVQGSWFTSARALHWTPKEFALTRGSAQLRPDGLALVAPDASGATLVSLTTSLRSASYPVIAWQAFGVPDDVEVAMLWRSDYEPARVFNRRLKVESGRVMPLSLDGDPNWKGTISGLALGFKGTYPSPILLRGATAKTMSAGELLGDRIGEWFTLEPWSGWSINTLLGGADVQDLPMPFTFAVVVGLAALICVGLTRWRPDWIEGSGVVIIGGMFVAAWFVLDVRWQWNLARQVALTADVYAGKSWHERHLAADDAAVFAFIEKARAKLPAPPARVFIAADDDYSRDRGAYHLYPYNVFFSPWRNEMPPVSSIRPGDYMIVYHRRGVQYDAAEQRLRWDGGTPVAAELLLVDSGAALFRIH
jgi:hypothetical protein